MRAVELEADGGDGAAEQGLVDAEVGFLGAVAGQPDGLGTQVSEGLFGACGGGDRGGHTGDGGSVREGGFYVCQGAGRSAEVLTGAGDGKGRAAGLGAQRGGGGAVRGGDGDDTGAGGEGCRLGVQVLQRYELEGGVRVAVGHGGGGGEDSGGNVRGGVGRDGDEDGGHGGGQEFGHGGGRGFGALGGEADVGECGGGLGGSADVPDGGGVFQGQEQLVAGEVRRADGGVQGEGSLGRCFQEGPPLGADADGAAGGLAGDGDAAGDAGGLQAGGHGNGELLPGLAGHGGHGGQACRGGCRVGVGGGDAFRDRCGGSGCCRSGGAGWLELDGGKQGAGENNAPCPET